MADFFLTGASGVVGSAIVPVLLSRTDARIHLLLRAKNDAALSTRLTELGTFWQRHYPQVSAGALEQRVFAVAGDITEPGLGLGAEDAERLRTSCTNIIHCAANVRMNLPLDEARATALYPVASVIELAEQCAKLQKVEFVSTVGVGGRWSGPLPERWISEAREFHNTYEASKAEAEDLVRTHIEQGLPASVHRPSMVVGDSRSGAVVHFQIFYFICDFLSGRRTLGVYPRLGEATLDLVPNDYVAEAIVDAALDRESAGQIFHLCSGPARAVRLYDLRERVRRSFRSAGHTGWLPKMDLSRENFTRLMQALSRLLPESERRAIQTLPMYLDYLSGIQQFSNAATTARLSARGIETPNNATVLERVLAYYLEAKR